MHLAVITAVPVPPGYGPDRKTPKPSKRPRLDLLCAWRFYRPARRALGMFVLCRSAAPVSTLACAAILFAGNVVAQPSSPKSRDCVNAEDAKGLAEDVDSLGKKTSGRTDISEELLSRYLASCSFDEALDRLRSAGFRVGEDASVGQADRYNGYVRTGIGVRFVQYFPWPKRAVINLLARSDGHLKIKGTISLDGP
jgi:hypothetical protein